MKSLQDNLRTLVVAGYGLRLAVERGHLVIEDGIGAERRVQRFARVGHGIARLVVLGHSGTVSLEALRWLHELGIAFLQLGRDGELIATGAPQQLRDVRVLRGQALAMQTPAGLAIARDLLVAKVRGQHRVLDRIEGNRGPRQLVADAIDQLADADSIDRLRFVESRAAAAYWQAWEGIPIRFAGRDAKHVPAHWRAFGTRSSPLTASPRKATNPANALLNYLYAVLEAEARLALFAVGCDPTLGVLHTDSRFRDSLACDLMEPVRPQVDAYVLALLESRTFARTDFFEVRDGTCRLMPEIARPLAMTTLQWAKAVAPVAERVAGAFLDAPRAVSLPVASGRDVPPAPRRYRTPLTGANYSRPKHPRSEPVATPPSVPNRCRGCGVDLKQRTRVYCDACLPEAARRASAKGARVLAQRRAIGHDGRSSEHARTAHRASVRLQLKAEQAWEAKQDAIPSKRIFVREIAPVLTLVPSRTMAEATGLTVSACNRIRRGVQVPHPRHWAALKAAAVQHRVEHGDAPDLTYAPEFFVQEVEPHLMAMAAEDMQRVTGLSYSFCRRIRRGHHVPRPKYWAALAKLAHHS